MKKQILACAVVAGLAAGTGQTVAQPAASVPSAHAGYLIYKAVTNQTSGIGQVAAQAGGAATGALIGGVTGKVVALKLGAKTGSLIGSVGGPVGVVIGAAIGAV